MTTTLADLKQGEKGIITKVKGRGAFRKRIIEMGFVVGKQVIVVKNAPLMDPIEYNIMGYEVSLRRNEARLIDVYSGVDPVKINTAPYHGVHELEQSLYLRNGIRSKEINIALVGNPNSGKTTLFNHASNSRERTANYSGVTVEAKTAEFKLGNTDFKLVDLPGTYSITSYTPEELYVRNYIFEQIPDVVINVVDASNLERNLYLTTQLIDMDIKVVIALNMFDEFSEKGDKFDYESLGKMIGIPVVPTVSSKGTGIRELFERCKKVHEDMDPTIRHIHINYGQEIESAIRTIQALIGLETNKHINNVISPRYLSIKLLEADAEEWNRIKLCTNYSDIRAVVEKETHKIEAVYNDKLETIISDFKYGFIEGALRETYEPSEQPRTTKSNLIDRILTSRLFSYPIFVLMMWFVFQATFILGDYPMQWIESFVTWLGTLAFQFLPDTIFRDMLVDGILGGVGGVIVFLPNILILFFFISLMETTGYMARVAFIIDKLMHKVGLHGRSFIPLLMGFGCNVPAIMATRTIENRSDRLITMMILPFMSCSARYPVYILIISAFFTAYRGTLLFGIYLVGILMAAIMAIVLRKVFFRKEEMPFVMELPPYRMPTPQAILKHTWFKGLQYLKKMGSIILIASMIIWALGYFPKGSHIDDQYNSKIELLTAEMEARKAEIMATDTAEMALIEQDYNEIIMLMATERMSLKQENSIIGRIGHFIEPALKPLGFDWKMGVSLLAGSAAKEIVISTMGVLYQTGPGDEVTESLTTKLREQKHETGPKTGQAVMRPLTALSFVIFILIYFPCIAVFAAIKKESGQWKWAAFTAIYTTVIAYIASLTIYQIGSLLGY
jgi:ferrous iron transport protein B